jgi:hypothetical protein
MQLIAGNFLLPKATGRVPFKALSQARNPSREVSNKPTPALRALA